jgi:hypothetical protein
LPDQIKWNENAATGNANAVLYGDPVKPGLYIVLVRWHAGHMSHPHFHPNNRFITVISGTWWGQRAAKDEPRNRLPAVKFNETALPTCGTDARITMT